jgi:hypothetical protein
MNGNTKKHHNLIFKKSALTHDFSRTWYQMQSFVVFHEFKFLYINAAFIYVYIKTSMEGTFT